MPDQNAPPPQRSPHRSAEDRRDRRLPLPSALGASGRRQARRPVLCSATGNRRALIVFVRQGRNSGSACCARRDDPANTPERGSARARGPAAHYERWSPREESA